jgi:hypothetical protein
VSKAIALPSVCGAPRGGRDHGRGVGGARSEPVDPGGGVEFL